jgi:hypothetical protein
LKICFHPYFRARKMNGFYNIDLDAPPECFKWGRITDIKTGETVCPGELCPQVFLETDPAVQDAIQECVAYTPLHRGTKLRIFWDEFQQRFNFSAETCIYPTPVILLEGKEGLDTASVQFDRLDRTICYYVFVEHASNRIVLHTAVDICQPALKLPPQRIEETDSRFAFNTRVYALADKERLSPTQQFDGFAYYFADGRYIEVRTADYHAWVTLKKPAHIGFQGWYRQLQLEDRMDEYLRHFPEHNYIFTQFKKNN